MKKFLFLITIIFILGCSENKTQDTEPEDKEPCSNITCSENANCEVINDEAICKCKDNYYGENCSECIEGYEFYGKECLSSPKIYKWGMEIATNQGQSLAISETKDIYITGLSDGDAFLSGFNITNGINWTKRWGEASSYKRGSSLAIKGNNIYITGIIRKKSDENFNFFLAKLDKNGNLLWEKEFDNSNSQANSLIIDNSENIYVTGSIQDTNNTTIVNIFLTKFNSEGEILWSEQWGSNQNDYGTALAIDSNNDVYLTGYTEGELSEATNAGGRDIFLIKFNSNGNKLWTKQFGFLNDDLSNSMAIDSNDNIYISGFKNHDVDDQDYISGEAFLTKFNSNGVEIWNKKLNSSLFDSGTSLVVDEENIYMLGTTFGSLDSNITLGESDIFLSKYNIDGQKAWTKQFGSQYSDFGSSLAIDSYKNIWITGSMNLDNEENSSHSDIVLYKIKQ